MTGEDVYDKIDETGEDYPCVFKAKINGVAKYVAITGVISCEHEYKNADNELQPPSFIWILESATGAASIVAVTDLQAAVDGSALPVCFPSISGENVEYIEVNNIDVIKANYLNSSGSNLTATDIYRFS